MSLTTMVVRDQRLASLDRKSDGSGVAPHKRGRRHADMPIRREPEALPFDRRTDLIYQFGDSPNVVKLPEAWEYRAFFHQGQSKDSLLV